LTLDQFIFCTRIQPNETFISKFIFWRKLPPNAGFGVKKFQKSLAPTPSRLHGRCVQGRKLPRYWWSWKPFPQIKIYHYTPACQAGDIDRLLHSRYPAATVPQQRSIHHHDKSAAVASSVMLAAAVEG